MTYSPHLSPLPHSLVEWISFISLSWLTLRLERSLSDISETAMSRRGVLAKARHGLTVEALSGSLVVIDVMVYVRAQDAAFCRVLHVDVDEKEKLILPKKMLMESVELRRTWQF